MKSINIVVRSSWLYPVLMLAAWAVSPGALRGSGSYVFQPPHPPAGVVEDSLKYELGKAIFGGKSILKQQAGAQERAQFIRLAQLQEMLPARVRKTVELTSLAGKLSSEQMSALEYFLKVRHKVG